jgi:hypothetical protein
VHRRRRSSQGGAPPALGSGTAASARDTRLRMSGRVLIVVPAVLGFGVGIALLAVSWFAADTFCGGIFKSSDQAEAAIEDARDAGLRFDDQRVAERSRRTVITVTANETGDDARELRDEFRRILARHGGDEGHPGGGCWERGIGD